tara:strand:+ start:20158 stop:20514 length:357 start_codon:yes stop_codon:yes gene_type:complete
MKNRQDELKIQIAVVNWIKSNFPEIRYCASSGGMRTSLSVAKKMKASGYVKGFPDLFLYHPTMKHNGLAIELKTMTGKLSPHQKEWITDLNSRGYFAKCTHGFEETIDLITEYLNENV